MSVVWYILVLCVVAAAIAYVVYNYQRIRKMPEGTAEMAEMAGIIRSGANTFMTTEYRTIIIVVILLAANNDFRIILPELDNMSVHFFGKIPAAVQCSQFQRRNGKGIIKYIFFRHFGPPGVM